VVRQVGALLVDPLAGFSETVPVLAPVVVLWEALLEHALESVTPIAIATMPTSHLVRRPFLLPTTSCIPSRIGLYRPGPLYRKRDAEFDPGLARTPEIYPACMIFGSALIGIKVMFSYMMAGGNRDRATLPTAPGYVPIEPGESKEHGRSAAELGVAARPDLH
jgi:hypothetical protein